MDMLPQNINKQIETYKESVYSNVKEYERFHFVKDHIIGKLKKGDTFLDVGCAKGEFIYFLKEYVEAINFTGFELSEDLLNLARNEPRLKDVEFIAGDLDNMMLDRQFDHVLMGGVLSIFDDIEKILRNMTNHIKTNGHGYIFGMANKFDMDVIVRFKNNFTAGDIWESGLNNFSLKTIQRFLTPNAKNIKIDEFKIALDLLHKEDPIKSYTLQTKEEGRIILNGTGMRTDMYLITFQKI